jgi:DNA-directed RNA polymerase alpha subunit
LDIINNKKNMPDFTADLDINPSEFVSECNTREKIELIDLIIEECSDYPKLQEELTKSIIEHFPQSSAKILGDLNGKGRTFMQDEFISNLDKLSKAYYCLSNEDIEKINVLAKRF